MTAFKSTGRVKVNPSAPQVRSHGHTTADSIVLTPPTVTPYFWDVKHSQAQNFSERDVNEQSQLSSNFNNSFCSHGARHEIKAQKKRQWYPTFTLAVFHGK